MPEPLQALLLEPYLVCVQHHAHNVALGEVGGVGGHAAAAHADDAVAQVVGAVAQVLCKQHAKRQGGAERQAYRHSCSVHGRAQCKQAERHS